MNNADVAEFLVSKAKQRPQILGAQLGGALAVAFPELRYQPDYPGLKRFIQIHCEGQLARVGDHGGDDIYQYVGEDAATREIIHSTNVPSAWDAFQKPGIDALLFVNTLTGELYVTREQTLTKENVSHVAPVSHDEHKGIARDFIAVADETQRPHLLAAVEPEDYWPQWSRIINSSFLKHQWTAFRFSKLCDLFRARLHAIPMEPTIVATSINYLIQEKGDRRVGNVSHSRNPPAAETRTGARSRSPVELRDLVHTAIDRLSETELRALRLPLGDILDVLGFPRR